MILRSSLVALMALAMGGWVAAPDAAAQSEQEEITRGAEVWGQQCARCHTPRDPNEYRDRDWSTVMLHMRTVANLSREQTEFVTAYLQAVSQPTGSAASADAGPEDETGSVSGGSSAESDGKEGEADGFWTVVRRYLSALRPSP